MKLSFLFSLLFISVFSFSQSATEIFLFGLKVENGQLAISNGRNITKHKGYDNQPFFHPEQPLIYYASFNDSGRSDIKYYNYNTDKTYNFTQTHDREYSPTVTPDGKHISCILQKDNGDQDLIQYSIDSGKKETLVNLLKVGYHSWAGNDKCMLFVLDDTSHNSLHLFYPWKQ